jgi:hypothetical protein
MNYKKMQYRMRSPFLRMRNASWVPVLRNGNANWVPVLGNGERELGSHSQERGTRIGFPVLENEERKMIVRRGRSGNVPHVVYMILLLPHSLPKHTISCKDLSLYND